MATTPKNRVKGLFSGINDDEAALLQVFFVLDRPTNANLRGMTQFSEARATAARNGLMERRIVKRVSGRYELTNREYTMAWFRANRPALLPQHMR